MKKQYILFPLFLLSILTLSACGQKNTQSNLQTETKDDNKIIEEKTSSIADVCVYFPKELVEAAIGKTIVKQEVSILGRDNCYYYTSYDEKYEHTPNGDKPGGPHVVVVYDTKDFAEDRATNEKFGSKYLTDPSIGMENFVMHNNVDKIWQTALVLGGDRYIRIKFVDDAVTGEDLVKIAQKFAEKIKGDSSLTLGGNSADNNQVTNSNQANISQQEVVNSFLSNLAGKNINNSLAMMDADEDMKQAWGTNFNTIETMTVKKIEEAFKEDWSTTRQSFKVELDVKVKPEGEQMGWQNGTNFRWITLEKNAEGKWMIHEIANNP